MFCSRAVFFLPQFVNALQKSLDLTLTNENVVCYWTFNSILSFVKQHFLLSYHYKYDSVYMQAYVSEAEPEILSHGFL